MVTTTMKTMKRCEALPTRPARPRSLVVGIGSALACVWPLALVSLAACAQIEGINALDPAVDGPGGAFCAAASRPTTPNGLFFCDDFDDGASAFPLPWNASSPFLGTLSVNSGAAASAPDSLEMSIDAFTSGQPDASLHALLGMPSLPTTMSFAFSVDPVKIDVATPNASIVLAAIDFLDAASNRSSVQLAFNVQKGAPLTEVDEQYSNRTPSYTPHPVTVALPIGAFTDVVIAIAWASATSATATVTFGGAQVQSFPLTMSVVATSVRIDIGTTYATLPSAGWDVRYDNVLFTAL